MANRIEGLTIFSQFGFREKTRSGNQSIGCCPFCGDSDHPNFFINVDSSNKTWDCKKCGRSGGYKSFLEQIVEYCDDKFTRQSAERLIQGRGLKYITFKNARVGYHPITGMYVLPVFSLDGKQIANVKLYDFKSMKNAAGCQAALYNVMEAKLKANDDIIICEGEWDTLAMEEVLADLKIKDMTAIGVPGAGTFKTDTLPAFSGKNIYLMYDNDSAGQMGMDKAIKLLSGVARRILRITWPAGFPEGHDVRDHYRSNKCDAKKTYTELMSWMNVAEQQAGSRVAEADIVDNGEPVPCGVVYKAFKKWLHIPDLTLIDVIFGTVLANKIPGDPLWMFLVAPSGATKTEPVLGLTECPRIETISTLTPHTLISGANFGGGGDPSLIPKLDKKVLVIKDFTSVLGLPQTERDEIFSILRDAYDGECSKPFGNGVTRKYKSTFGVLACVTPAIEFYADDHAALGERFLRWRNFIPNNMDSKRVYIEKALSNVSKEVELRSDLHEITSQVLRAKYEVIPVIPEDITKKIVSLAQLISMLRGAVHRDKFTRDITHKSFAELGTRVSKQLFKLLLGVGMFHQTEIINEDEYQIAVEVARSTIPSRLMEVVDMMYRAVVVVTALDVAKATGFNPNIATLILDNLAMLGAVHRVTDALNTRSTYQLRNDVLGLIEHSHLIERG